MPTHEVQNQVPPLVGYNLFTSDRVLAEAAEREGAGWVGDTAERLGQILGGEEAIDWGFDANNNPPVLHTHDARGRRIDEVRFHPAWHSLMRLSVAFGLHNLPWREPRAGGHVARAALFRMAGQNEAGHSCPISMTYAAVPTLRRQAELAAEWEPRIASTTYDERFAPAGEKSGVLLGMAMTEKQGGSDVRANTTRARAGRSWRTGRRIPDHRAQVVLLGADVRRVFGAGAGARRACRAFCCRAGLPDGTRNNFFLQRLKNKLGNRSNASSEVEFDDAYGHAGRRGRPRRADDRGDGQSHAARLHAGLGSGMMRQAVVQATHHARHRAAFGLPLVEQPLMQNVLADLCDRIGSRHGAGDATGPGLRPIGRERSPVSPDRHGGGQVLGLQAGRGARGRGARMPGRQRLRRRLVHAAAVSRVAAELDLGRLGQRDLPGRVAGDRQRAADDRRPAGRDRAGTWPRRAVRSLSSRRSSRQWTRRWRPMRARPGDWSSDWPWPCKDRSCCAIRRPSWPRPSAPRDSRRTADVHWARCRRKSIAWRLSIGRGRRKSIRSNSGYFAAESALSFFESSFSDLSFSAGSAGPSRAASCLPSSGPRARVLTTLPSLSTRITVGMPMMP